MANDLTTTRHPLPPLAAVPRLSDMGLEEWSPAAPELPPGLTKARLSTEMAAASRSLAPASPQQRAVFEVMMGDFFAVQSMRLGDDLAPAYWAQVWAVIGDLPPDLLRRAAERIAATWRWPTPPRPADYRAAVAEQMAERSAARAKLDTALRFGREAEKPGKRDPATIAKVAEIVGGWKARPNTTQEPPDADLARLKAQALAQVAATKEDAA